MEQNVGMPDRYIRITLGGLLLAAGAGYMGRRSAGTGMMLGLLGGMMLAEGVLGTCPLYSAAGINTRAESEGVSAPPPGERANDVIDQAEGI